MNEEEIKKVNGWFGRAENENKDMFVKFARFFIAIEALKGNKKCSKECSEGNKECSNYCFLYMNKEKFEEKLAEEDRKNLFEEIQKKPLKTKYYGDISLDSPDDTDSIIKILVGIRNNLFHGDKALDDSRDGVLVALGSKLLEPIVKGLKEDYDNPHGNNTT